MASNGTPDENPAAGKSRSSAARHAAALALATGKTVRAAAKLAGVGERTLHRWIKRPAFKRAIHRHRQRLTDEVVGQLARDLRDAVRTLRTLNKKGEREETRLRAANSIADVFARLRESGEFAERLAEVEARLADRDSKVRR